MTRTEQEKIEAFIRKKGVKKCPATGDPALQEYHRKQEEQKKAWFGRGGQSVKRGLEKAHFNRTKSA